MLDAPRGDDHKILCSTFLLQQRVADFLTVVVALLQALPAPASRLRRRQQHFSSLAAGGAKSRDNPKHDLLTILNMIS
jgi:hypothetical protein